MAHFLEHERGRQWGVWKPSLKTIERKLGALPPVLTEQEYSSDGFIVGENGLLVPAYIANSLGFHKWGRHVLDDVIYPRLKMAGIFPLDPFLNCTPFLPEGVFDESQPVSEQRNRWKQFDKDVITWVNYGALMPASGLLIAILDGDRGIDDGVAFEMGYYKGKFGPIVGFRTDFRGGENPGTAINPALLHAFDDRKFGGAYFEGPNAAEQAYEWIAQYTSEILEK